MNLSLFIPLYKIGPVFTITAMFKQRLSFEARTRLERNFSSIYILYILYYPNAWPEKKSRILAKESSRKLRFFGLASDRVCRNDLINVN